MKKVKKIKCFILILIIILIVLICSIFHLVNNHPKNKKSDDNITLNFESRVDKLNNFDSGDYYKFGWLQVQGTTIDLPILDYRVSENNDVNYSFAWLSPNSVTTQNRLLINGHNILNISSTPLINDENLTDFEPLMAFSYYSFAKDNLYIQYTNNGQDEIYLIYSVGFYDSFEDSIYSYDYDDIDNLNNYINTSRKKSIYDYDIDVKATDKLITLKTCTRYFGLYEKQSFIINARKLRDDEKVVKYKVITNSLFDELINNDKKA